MWCCGCLYLFFLGFDFYLYYVNNRKDSRMSMPWFILTKKTEKWLFSVVLEQSLFLFVVFLFIGKEGRKEERGKGEKKKTLYLLLTPYSRFVFYDEVHTTGMDIAHRSDAVGVVTLGKDMTFRDYAQGAFRLRQIGRGQKVILLLTPEVNTLIQKNIQKCGEGYQTFSEKYEKMRKEGGVREDEERRVVVDGAERGLGEALREVVGWLVVSGGRGEELQHRMLCQQTIGNVWRKKAMVLLLEGLEEIGN